MIAAAVFSDLHVYDKDVDFVDATTQRDQAAAVYLGQDEIT